MTISSISSLLIYFHLTYYTHIAAQDLSIIIIIHPIHSSYFQACLVHSQVDCSPTIRH